ncbi:hypothetical protein [Saprospira grandis]|uniref:Lipoprotein n=1 Tax=Saprospira grandis (strain Lewin) TaxID=984262 RepID=H6L3T4_SAPGL|nr:hypothetical protein [Saprospira grandis]AFC22769.1 hypothetical protein SGRA_0024 [Saprospira grandis str. Lewin]
MNRPNLLLLVFASLFLFSCGPKQTEEGLPLDEYGREDFLSFHHKFFHEIDFQLARIDFPITGPKMANGLPKIIEEKDWTLLRPIEGQEGVERQFAPRADDLMEEYIIAQKAFVIKLRYQHNEVQNKWYLTYYSGITGDNMRATVDSSKLDSNRVLLVHPDSMPTDK